MKRQCRVSSVLVIVFLVGHLSAGAASLGDVMIHGFGGWAYGITDNENKYLSGIEDGNYATLNFSLNITANPYERLSLYIQTGYNESLDENEVALDYAFAEWLVANPFVIRVGKIKAPFMLYTETYDVGTIRPFFYLPQGLYQQLAAEAYKGVGLTGTVPLGTEWDLAYDAYGGTLDLQPNPFVVLRPTGELYIDRFIPTVVDMIGGRLTLHPPLDGFGFSVSSYSGNMESSGTQTVYLDPDKRYLFLGASVEYVSEHAWLRSEYLSQHQNTDVEIDVAYGELAYAFNEQWQVACRYEWTNFKLPAVEQFFPTSFFEHTETVLGVNYWFNPNLVLKVSYHLVNGNRFASPETTDDFVAALQQGHFTEETRLISLGVQFSF